MAVRNPTRLLIEEITECDTPSLKLKETYENGLLQRHLPEVYALFGVPQVATHHPEICTGVHTGMAIDMAKELHGSECAMLALLHDLGKGITDKAKLPHHHSHESTGVPLVEAVCRRAGYDARTTRMAVATCKNHLLVHTVYILTPKRLIQLIRDLRTASRTGCADDEVKSWRGTQMILAACEADARGRLGMRDRTYHNVRLIKQVFNELVAVQEITKPGYRPSEQDKHHFASVGMTFKDVKRTRQGYPYFDGNEVSFITYQETP